MMNKAALALGDAVVRLAKEQGLVAQRSQPSRHVLEGDAWWVHLNRAGVNTAAEKLRFVGGHWAAGNEDMGLHTWSYDELRAALRLIREKVAAAEAAYALGAREEG